MDDDESADLVKEEEEPAGMMTTLLEDLLQPSQMVFDADPDDWMFGSATVDEESVASGFSTAMAIEWMPATGVTYCCETFHNRILKIESDGKAVPFVGEKYGYRDGPLQLHRHRSCRWSGCPHSLRNSFLFRRDLKC